MLNRILHQSKSLDISVYLLIFLLISTFYFPWAHAKDRGDALVTASIGQPKTLLPLFASDASSSVICSFIYNGLLKYDENLKLVGDLAQSWEVSDEGKRIIFHLKKNVKWHDGVEFTADDVKFTYEKYIDPNVLTPYGGDFKMIKEVDVKDKYTVEIVYAEPFSPALESWGKSIIPKHLLEDKDLNSSDFARNPIGTGPYKFRKWDLNGQVELVAFDDYFEGSAYIDRVIFRVIPDTATIFLELLAGNIDNASLTPLQYLKHTQTHIFTDSYKKFHYPSNSFLYLGYNLDNHFFKDKLVRKALNFAVDKKEIIKAVYLDQADISTGPYTRESWAYDDSFGYDEFSPVKAKEMLKEAGFTDSNSDGILDKDGQDFEFTIYTNQGNLERKMAAEIIQKRLSDIGIKVNIRSIEWSVFVHNIIKNKSFDAVLLGWNLTLDPDLFDIFHSSKNNPGEFNFIDYKNDDVDQLLVEGRREFDIKKRKEIYKKVRDLIYDDQPYMFICSAYSLSAIHKRFQGVVPKEGGYWYNFIDWWVDKKDQKYTRFKR